MGKTKIKLSDIATEMKISIATVSRILNNKPDVNPRTKEKVLRFLEEIGYTNENVPTRLKMIGIVCGFTDFNAFSEDHYDSILFSRIESIVSPLGYYALQINPDRLQPGKPHNNISQLLNSLDGLIWLEAEYTLEIDEIIKSFELPSVVVNHCSAEIDQHVVSSEHFNAASQAVQYLFNRGHRAIGFVGGHLNLNDHARRYEGYISKMESVGLETRTDWIIDDLLPPFYGEDAGREAMHRMLTIPEPPSAIILINDNIAIGAYSAAKELVFRIPEDVSFIGFDDFPFAPHLNPPLSSMRQETGILGELAAK
ncbi:LacI family transcriptional regulator, partial [bacterium]|nr:LacI family transcriptional regulator [bacterium]